MRYGNLKSEWWDIEGAKQQLSDEIGWYFGASKDSPIGWILCKRYNCYKTGEIECLGYNNYGVLENGKELQPLVGKLEEWASEQGFVNMRYTIGTTGLSCHGENLKKPWEELRDLHAVDSLSRNYLLAIIIVGLNLTSYNIINGNCVGISFLNWKFM